MNICGATDQGRLRDNNEDYLAYDAALGVAVLADGMGGLNAGEVASETAVRAVMRVLAARPNPPGIDRRSLENAFAEANRTVFELAAGHRELAGMGTTLVVAQVGGEVCRCAHVGDSRLYHFARESDALRQVTVDHSLVQQLVDEGVLSADQARRAPNRNIVTRAIGISPAVACDVMEFRFPPGDLVVLATDGLTDLVEDEVIATRCRALSDDPAALARALIDDANSEGGFDNISLIVIRR